MTWVIHRARVSPVVCAHALVSKYTFVWYGIRWYTTLWYATLWYIMVRSFVPMSLCPNAPFPHHRLSKLQKSPPSDQCSDKCSNQCSNQCLNQCSKQFVWKQFIINILSLVYLSCHITGHKAKRMSLKLWRSSSCPTEPSPAQYFDPLSRKHFWTTST